MNKKVYHQLKLSIKLSLSLILILGIAYPLLVTGFAYLFFKEKAQGSLIQKDGKILGSVLLGQFFDDPKYFWGRPSATSPIPYNTLSSHASNLGPLNPKLKQSIETQFQMIKRVQVPSNLPMPIDLLMSSGSGLDPHISPAAAFYQVSRISSRRTLPEQEIIKLIENQIEGRQFGFLGEPRVNVLKLNLALDNLQREYKNET